ncbi:sigma-54 interaction domain-containing protein [Comamonas composti]|uniref:sigma-54 interaction domain-containing protein n=1 Tax=Comamonas composti TaxID=408558 RepID=UPI00047B7F01|nr:sigma-54-dependent Fis family transcriptional regulator [Comamonas composti]
MPVFSAFDHRFGVFVWRRDARVPVVLLGLAQDPLLRAAVDKARLAQEDGALGAGRLLHVEVPGVRGAVSRYVAIELADAESTLVLVRPADEAAALLDLAATVPFAFAILNMFLTHPYQAITVADHEGRMRYISPVHEKFFGLEPGAAIGRRAEEVIPNSRLPHVARSGKAEIGDLQQVSPQATRVVNRIPIFEGGMVVGAVGQVSFSGVEALNRMQQRLQQLRDEVQHYRRELSQLRDSAGSLALVGSSAPMQRLAREIDAVARLDVPVLILGESGSGKELVAQALHARGRDPGAPMVCLNLAALPATLIEAELFGYEAGAFTGGRKQGQPGKLEQAEGGTLFLDEVADIPMEVQVKLLRVLEDRQVQRLGARSGRHVDFRVVAATHRDLRALIDSGRFRLDLFYRLSGVVLQVPALRQHLEDIPALVQRFVQSFCERNQLPLPRIAPGVMAYLAQNSWPGNVRQLRQRIEEALVFCDGKTLAVENFARYQDPLGLVAAGSEQLAPMAATAPVAAPLKVVERQAILAAIERCSGNKKQAAQALGISRSYLYKVLARS